MTHNNARTFEQSSDTMHMTLACITDIDVCVCETLCEASGIFGHQILLFHENEIRVAYAVSFSTYSLVCVFPRKAIAG